MDGTLNMFRLRENPPEYQVTYNSGPASWVRVFDPEAVGHFLRTSAGLPVDPGASLARELLDGGHATAVVPGLSEPHLVEMGFTKMPSDD